MIKIQLTFYEANVKQKYYCQNCIFIKCAKVGFVKNCSFILFNVNSSIFTKYLICKMSVVFFTPVLENKFAKNAILSLSQIKVINELFVKKLM